MNSELDLQVVVLRIFHHIKECFKSVFFSVRDLVRAEACNDHGMTFWREVPTEFSINGEITSRDHAHKRNKFQYDDVEVSGQTLIVPNKDKISHKRGFCKNLVS